MLIPPYTDFSASSFKDYEKVYCHFNFQANIEFQRGIHSFSIDSTLQKQFISLIEGDQEKEASMGLALLCLQAISTGLGQIFPVQAEVSKLNQHAVKLIRLMQENKSKVLNNKLLSHAVCMSENAMVRDFKHQTGETPQKYYLRLRLEHACELLVKSNLSIEEISEQCGFWDRNHFTRFFTRQWNVAPGVFRKLNTR